MPKTFTQASSVEEGATPNWWQPLNRKETSKAVDWEWEEMRGLSSACSSDWESLHPDLELAWQLELIQEKHKSLEEK